MMCGGVLLGGRGMWKVGVVLFISVLGLHFVVHEVNLWEVYGLGAVLDEETCVMGTIIIIVSAKEVVFKLPCVY